MHILSRGFSQRRSKSAKKPRDLHIRKVSFSGSSLSSASDASTVTYTPRLATFYAAAPTPIRDRSNSTSTGTTAGSAKLGDYFSSSWPSGSPHRTHNAPPRLYERPIIYNDKSNNMRYEEAATFFEDDSSEDDWDEDEEDAVDSDSGYEASVREVLDAQEEDLMRSQSRESSASFFTLDLSARPPMPRSRWSESTIQTLDLDTLSRVTSTANLSMMEATNEDDEEEEEREYEEEEQQSQEETREEPHAPEAMNTDLKRADFVQRSHSVPTKMPNFSYKRATEPQATTPKRPPMKTMDSLEDFIKRGGWKRRGIIFHGEEITCGNSQEVVTATDI